LVYQETSFVDSPSKKGFAFCGGLYADTAPISEAVTRADGAIFRVPNGNYRIKFSTSRSAAIVFEDEATMNRAIKLWKRQQRHCARGFGTVHWRLEKVNLNKPSGKAKDLKITKSRMRKLFNGNAVANSTIECDEDHKLATGFEEVTFVSQSKDGILCRTLNRKASPRQMKEIVNGLMVSRVRIA